LLEELRARNDLELYDLQADREEMVNLAHDFDRNRDLIGRMNDKLNALIAAEIGVDDGSFLPFQDFIDWGPAKKAGMNL
jgi:arylsulfatase A-like enzyme